MVVHDKQEGSRPPAFLCINAIKYTPTTNRRYFGITNQLLEVYAIKESLIILLILTLSILFRRNARVLLEIFTK